MDGKTVWSYMAYALLVTVHLAASSELQPLYCKDPRPTLVSIDHPYYKYWPFFVELGRCGGSCSHTSPRVQRCQASETSIISHTVYELATEKTKVLQLTNHTRCNCSCAQTPDSCAADVERWDPGSCSCACIQPTNRPFPCPDGFKWMQSMCKCICDRAPEVCSANKEWSHEACRCVCKMDIARKCNEKQQLLNHDTCTCYDKTPVVAAREDKGVPRDVVIGSMFAELVVLLLVFDAFLFCKYRYGIMALIYYKCCAKDDDREVRADTASIPLNCEANGQKPDEPETEETSRAEKC